MTELGPTLLVSTEPHEDEATPDRLSVAPAVAVAEPFSNTGFGDTVGLSVGALASRLIVTDSLPVPPALVQLKPVVGEVGSPPVHPSASAPGQLVPSACTTVHGPVAEVLLKDTSRPLRSPPGGQWTTATVTVTDKLSVVAAPPLIEID